MELDSVSGAALSGGEAKNMARSCSICSKAKAKCVRRPGQQACERYDWPIHRVGAVKRETDQCSLGVSG